MRLGRKIERIFLAGLFATLPLIITFVLLKIFFEAVDGLLSPVFRVIFKRHVPGLGLLSTVLLIFLMGLMVKNLVGRLFIGRMEEFISKIPFIKTIYTSAKQLIFSFSPENKKGLKRVIAVKFFGENYSLGFVTNETVMVIGGEEKKAYAVFLPTTPSPVTGFYLIIPQKNVIHLDLNVEDAIKMLISGGAILPKGFIEEKRIIES